MLGIRTIENRYKKYLAEVQLPVIIITPSRQLEVPRHLDVVVLQSLDTGTLQAPPGQTWVALTVSRHDVPGRG